MKTLGLVFLALAPAFSAAQLPEAPTPRLDLALYGIDATSRVLDVVSSNQAFGRGAHEAVLPHWIADNTGTFVAFEASVLTVEYIGAYELRRHGHPKLARLVPIIDAAGCFAMDIHNFRSTGYTPVAKP